MLRIAVPNKGSLSEPAAAMLKEAGYRTRRDPKELVVTDADNGVELFYLRPRDIAVYVGEGMLDVGLTGRDLMLDSGAPVAELMALGFGQSVPDRPVPAERFAGQVEERPDLAQHLVGHEVHVQIDQACDWRRVGDV